MTTLEEIWERAEAELSERFNFEKYPLIILEENGPTASEPTHKIAFTAKNANGLEHKLAMFWDHDSAAAARSDVFVHVSALSAEERQRLGLTFDKL